MHVVKTVYHETWLIILRIIPTFSFFRYLKRVGGVLPSPEFNPFLSTLYHALTELQTIHCQAKSL